MIFLLGAAFLASDMPQRASDPARARAERQCRAGLARKTGGEISDFSVAEFRRSGRHLVLSGTANVLTKPPAHAGELTPAHVINMRYSYECRLTGSQAPHLKITPLSE
ncbi:MAG TPA: hypothetical protein VH331_18545 [Allosphingosinicella sp.]|nr:hypothetical protein [Allosphingosinicella sp.]